MLSYIHQGCQVRYIVHFYVLLHLFPIVWRYELKQNAVVVETAPPPSHDDCYHVYLTLVT